MTFPIVAIGASAGGLEAISELLAALPSKSGMAYLVVQHLDPVHESLLPEILAKKTSMPVLAAHEGMTIVPDHVYVITPKTTLTVQDDRLHLTPRGGPARHMPADALFKSLAETRGDSAIAIVLSGADSDGALGIQEIKHNGGITFAQEPGTAKFPSMPRSAIETGCVDFVLAPRRMARELKRLGDHPYLRLAATPSRPIDDGLEAVSTAEEASLRRIFRQLRSAHGVDFTHYKRSTLRRRLARRMALQKIEDLTDYSSLIEGDPAETGALYLDFLIRVTGFFRDPDSFEGLAQRVFPNLCESRSSKQPIRVWIPGCATGEEVYSIAIALVEHLGERHAPEGIQIFGTDVSEAAIERARAGVYLDTIRHDVSGERLARFFMKQDGHYRIAKSIRDLCIFARQDVTRDPPFSRLDLISCRNLLIYLDAAVQRRVMQIFHYALNPRGFLMLGPSESVGQAADLFEVADKHHRIYERKVLPGAAGDLATPSGMGYGRRPHEEPTDAAPLPLEADSAQREADRLLLARFAPASLLVDEALNILQVRGETGPYLEFSSGTPSLNLRRITRPELLVEIAPAIQEVREMGSAVRREGLSIDQRDLSIEVIPVKRLSSERCYLILFDDGTRRAGSRRAQTPASALPESEKDRRLVQLERETASLRDYLQATVEEHEAVKEELKSAHEEVLSANEEFQSTNEELETSKEELQSANEELTTTNDELRNRNRELAVLNAEVERARAAADQARAAAEVARASSEQARAYAEAIVNSVREPLLVLAEDLTILRANEAYHADFRERPGTATGFLLYEVGNGQWNLEPLRERLDAVLSRNEPMSNFEITREFPAIGVRTMSLSARKIPGDGERSELILFAIEDITERKHAEQAALLLTEIVTSSDDAIISKDLDGNITSWNKGAQDLFGYTAEEVIGKPITLLMPPDQMDEEPGILQRIRRGETIEHYETVRRRKDGTLLDVSLTISAIRDTDGRIVGAAKFARNITERKRAEARLRDYAAQLSESDHRKNEFLAMLAHELRNPLSPITHAVHLLRGTHTDPTSTKLYEMIGRQTQRLVRLVDELLDVARIERGLIAVKRERLDLGVIVRQAAESSRLRIEQGQHSFSLALPEEPVYVDGDAVRLEQVICNLLENAAKYTNQSGEIALALTREQTQAVVRVRDTGIGLAPEMLEGIFGLFTQVDRSLSRSRGGLGLGLAVVRRILELHGGHIEARSAGLGQGSEFIVQLPLSTGVAPTPAVPEAAADAPPSAPRNRRVLIVEDNADAAQSLAQLTRSWGHEVLATHDASGAISLAESFAPDAALIDIGLPGADGYELARRLRARPGSADMYLIAVTGYGREEDRSAALDAGFDAHFVKPAPVAELQTLLAKGDRSLGIAPPAS